MRLGNRLDAHESILAGARYLQQLQEALPSRIAPPDRIWLALAAYNIGLGHIEDARVLTQRRGGNPDLWVDVKKALRLLTRYEYYSTVKHGFCRGGEALVLTESTRNYYDILARFEKPHTPGFDTLIGSAVRGGVAALLAVSGEPGSPPASFEPTSSLAPTRGAR